MNSMISHGRYKAWLQLLLVIIVFVMGLGAAVRAMNAGLSCPDWPLCFGKFIPDFHPAVWFEFVHRACVGGMTIIFLLCAFYGYKKSDIPSGVRRASAIGLLLLIVQIVFGALTVRLQVMPLIVTTHLTLATFFFLCVFWMVMSVDERVDVPHAMMPSLFTLFAKLLPFMIFAQLVIGGFVASTYAGSVCIDWPLCNGQWVPTWTGSIGLQIIHRFVAYFLAVSVATFAILLQKNHVQPWVTPQFLRISRWAAIIVCVQVVLGILNLMMAIPPWLTVVHQTTAIILLAVATRLYFVVSRIQR